MNIDFGDGIAAFRAEVIAFLDAAPTPAIRGAGRKTTSVFAPFEEVMAWQRILNDKGWAAPAWPVEHGGTGWSLEQRYVFAEEYWQRDLPPRLPDGLLMVARALLLYTTALAESGRAARRDISLLKAQVGRLGRSLAESAVQVHGGVGMTDELVIGHYLKRILAVDTMFGSGDLHLRIVGATLPDPR